MAQHNNICSHSFQRWQKKAARKKKPDDFQQMYLHSMSGALGAIIVSQHLFFCFVASLICGLVHQFINLLDLSNVHYLRDIVNWSVTANLKHSLASAVKIWSPWPIMKLIASLFIIN